MKLTSNRREISTGFTPLGQLYVRVTEGSHTLIKTTRDPLEFLRTLLGVPDEEALRAGANEGTDDAGYLCRCCHGGFVSGGGARISDELFCTPCLQAYNHYDYFRSLNLTDGFINHLVENRMRYL